MAQPLRLRATSGLHAARHRSIRSSATAALVLSIPRNSADHVRLNQLPSFECRDVYQDCTYTCTDLGPGRPACLLRRCAMKTAGNFRLRVAVALLKRTAGLSASEAGGRGLRARLPCRTMRASTRLADPVGHRLHQGVHQAEDDLDAEADEEGKGTERQRHALQPNRLVAGPDHAHQSAQGRAQQHA